MKANSFSPLRLAAGDYIWIKNIELAHYVEGICLSKLKGPPSVYTMAARWEVLERSNELDER